jgi:type IV pilus assembly protein PilM
MKSAPFGLDIGTNMMKAVWLSRTSNGFFLNASASSPTPQKGMQSESPFDQEEMARAIKRMVTEATISTPYVNIALPENQVYSRVVEMPVLSDKELSSAIYWEAEQYIPVPLTSVMFDYKVLKRPGPGHTDEKMEVLLVGAQNAVMQRYQKVFSLAGLEIGSVETELLATVRSLTYTPGVTDLDKIPACVVVNMRTLYTALAIVRKGIVSFTYTIPIGGITISRAIADDFGFTVSQAEEYKNVYGVYGNNIAGKIGKATEPILMSLISEIKKALAYYNEKFTKDDPIRQILLTGEAARVPGVELFFVQNSGIETVVVNPWKVAGNQQLPPEMVENGADYAVAIGLAMKNV